MQNLILIAALVLAFTFGLLIDRSLNDSLMICVPKQPPVQAEGGY